MEMIERFDGRAFPTTVGLARQWAVGPRPPLLLARDDLLRRARRGHAAAHGPAARQAAGELVRPRPLLERRPDRARAAVRARGRGAPLPSGTSMSDAPHPELRASDDDRERTADTLRRAAGRRPAHDGRARRPAAGGLRVAHPRRAGAARGRRRRARRGGGGGRAPRRPAPGPPRRGRRALADRDHGRLRAQGPLAPARAAHLAQHHGRQRLRPQRRGALRPAHRDDDLLADGRLGRPRARGPQRRGHRLRLHGRQRRRRARLAPRPRRPGPAPAADLDHGRHERPPRPQEDARGAARREAAHRHGL